MGYIDNDGEINEDRYQEALEKQWDEEYEVLNPEPKRAPKHLGAGMYVEFQFNTDKLVVGDMYFDADFGSVEWNGTKWIQR